MWEKGEVIYENERYIYHIKVFEEGSVYGIKGGKISKLSIIHNREVIVSYDRGWDIKPATAEAKAVLKLILKAKN